MQLTTVHTMENYKKLASDFLINTFVENYEAYREYVDQLNRILEQQSDPYTYSYDDFCIELLNRFISSIEHHCLQEGTYEDVCERFEDLLTITVRDLRYK